MATVDDIIAEEPADVQSAIEDICEAAGTWDADVAILIAAGRMIATLRGRV